jgi:hypothetical protein
MSQPPNVGTTLTGGIQDIAALLPLLGTDQCEKHVGSALEGGYLYAAATPLSIFGSLGVVKIGISVLVSSISIPKPSFSFKFTPYPKLSVTFHGRRWLGARILDNAGFKPVGTVAPLIAMDGTRYAAETRLMEILKEKHIEDPERLSVEWKSAEWNVMLVLCIVVAAVCSVIPYIALISLGLRTSVRLPWIFPFLRTVGGSLAAVCCQFLIQSRVVSLMKNRIVFMIMNHVVLDNLKSKNMDIHSQNAFRWDENAPSEECLWDLEQYLRYQCSNTQRGDGPTDGVNLPTSPSDEHSTTGEHQDRPRDVSIQISTFEFSKPEEILDKLHDARKEHIQTSSFNSAFIFISWIILWVSLPATVAGYIGCFTLVSASRGNGPLVWLSLEAALSIIRILVWAWNPSFDERTDITVTLKLTDHQPLVTTEKYKEVIEQTGENTLSLIPERQFLEWITSYTGPLEQFQTTENLALYFTLSGNRAGRKHLYLTIFDFNKRIAATLHEEKEELMYIDTVVTYDDIANEMQALLQSSSGKDHPWRKNHAILFDTLSHYYFSIIDALNRSHLQSTTFNNPGSNRLHMMFGILRLPSPNNNTQNDLRSVKTALISRKWNLLPKPAEANDESPATIRTHLSLTEHDKMYLQRGYEHHLKTKLVENWGRWIVNNMDRIGVDAQNDCHHALTNRTSDKAKRELTELDMQLAFEWTKREWSLVVSSSKLEGILHQRNKECINQIVEERQNGLLGEWMLSEFAVERRRRLEKEREQAKERMETGMKVGAERAKAEVRVWRDRLRLCPKGIWEAGQEFINKQWEAAIESREVASASDLDQLIERNTLKSEWWEDEERKAQRIFVEQVRKRFKHWQHQHRNEKVAMDAIVEQIRNSYDAYQYPEWYWRVTDKFVELQHSQSVAKLCSATVYDVDDCSDNTIKVVIQKETTRSVIKVPSRLVVGSIPENDHLLYLSSMGGKEPPFIKRNRDRWWGQQISNSSTFYFSPQRVGGLCVYSESHTISHIFIFLKTRARVRLRLLHCRFNQASVSIREEGKGLRFISAKEISEQLQLQDFELNSFEPGRHELELVVTRNSGIYCLRDILVEFEDSPSHSSKDLKGRSQLRSRPWKGVVQYK